MVSGDCCQKIPTVQTLSFESRQFEFFSVFGDTLQVSSFIYWLDKSGDVGITMSIQVR